MALYSLWPVVISIESVLPANHEDLVTVWVLNQTINKIPNNLTSIFQGNIFYPYKNTMAYSDLMIPSALVSYIPTKLTNEPVVAYNFALIFGQITTMVVVYFWFNEITKKRSLALLGSVLLGLAPFRIYFFGHLHMWTMQWWLIAAWMIWRFTKNKQLWQLYLAGLMTAIQTWESLQGVLFIMFTGAAILLPRIKYLVKKWKHLLVITSMYLVLVAPVLFTYWSVSRQFNYVRPIREVAHFSASLEQIWGVYSNPILYIFAAFCLLAIIRKKTKIDSNLRWLLIILFIGLIMSLGPALKINEKTFKIFSIPIPLPYAVAYYLIPGFKALRAPSRWLWLSTFASAGIVTLVLSKLKARLFLVSFLIVATIIGGARLNEAFEVPGYDDYPAVYIWLKEQSAEAIIEIPTYTWAQGSLAKNELYRMLYSIKHKKNLFNGYSGFSPAEHERLVHKIRKEFPSIELEEKLVNLGFSYVLIHKNEYEKDKLDFIEAWGKDKIIWESEGEVVYQL